MYYNSNYVITSIEFEIARGYVLLADALNTDGVNPLVVKGLLPLPSGGNLNALALTTTTGICRQFCDDESLLRYRVAFVWHRRVSDRIENFLLAQRLLFFVDI